MGNTKGWIGFTVFTFGETALTPKTNEAEI
jgi:hypothetical protein